MTKKYASGSYALQTEHLPVVTERSRKQKTRQNKRKPSMEAVTSLHKKRPVHGNVRARSLRPLVYKDI